MRRLCKSHAKRFFRSEMTLSNLTVAISTIGKITNEVNLDWLGKIIQSLIEGCGSIGVGIIVFTLILKLITLPFDIFSRVSTKKNSVRMEKMRPELEKLQRNYANNSELYQKKMQEVYKQNGYSPFSACLPTLLNLIIFIVVIGQFSTYSNFANFDVFCKMSAAYEDAVDYFDGETTEYIINDEENGRLLDLDYYYNNDADLTAYGFDVTPNQGYNASFTYNERTSEQLARLYAELEKGENGLLYEYSVGESGIMVKNGDVYEYTANLGVDKDGNAYDEESMTRRLCSLIVERSGENFVQTVIKEAGRQAAAEEYRKYDLSFLWVKNIWSQDLPWEHPVKETFASYNFVKSSGCAASCKASCGGESNAISSVTEEQYKELTANLADEKSQPNGYLILVLLSIGMMLLSQIVMNKANKAQMELSTVDGENGTSAMSQKMMTWMMPLMYGIFSFMYTASFSIYMVVSSAFGLISTLLINYFVEKGFEKQAAKEARELELKRTGRIRELEESKNKKGKNKK